MGHKVEVHFDQVLKAWGYTRQRDGKDIYIPVNVIGNIFVSNGMSAGNTKFEARVQGLHYSFLR